MSPSQLNPLICDEGQVQCEPTGRLDGDGRMRCVRASRETCGSYCKILDALGDCATERGVGDVERGFTRNPSRNAMR